MEPESPRSEQSEEVLVRPHETTLLSHDGQTDGRTEVPAKYLSIRLTQPHSKLDEVLTKVCAGVSDYCIYKHLANTSNEHFHICIPGGSDGAYRKRLGRLYGTGGNKLYSVKQFDNGCRSFMFYCGHESVTPIYPEGSFWSQIEVDTYYVKQTGQKMLPMEKKSKDTDSDWQLTYANFVPKCVNHARVNGLTGGLKEVLQHMLEHSRWRPSFHMVKNGVPDHYYKDYEFRSGKRKRMDMDWMTPKF